MLNGIKLIIRHICILDFPYDLVQTSINGTNKGMGKKKSSTTMKGKYIRKWNKKVFSVQLESGNHRLSLKWSF